MSEFAHCAGVGPAGSVDGVNCGNSALQSVSLVVRRFSENPHFCELPIHIHMLNLLTYPHTPTLRAVSSISGLVYYLEGLVDLF